MSAKDMLETNCRVCGHRGAFKVHVAVEMMFGTAESFDYVECPACGCVQIARIPNSLGQYYPEDYYSMQPRMEPPRPTGLKRMLTNLYCGSQAIHRGTWRANIVKRLLPEPTDWRDYGDMLLNGGLRSRADAILDVGCGSSPYRLAAFQRLGFGNVAGVDPFVAHDLVFEGVPVRKQTIFECEGEYAWIMFHHSLEHMEDPVAALAAAAKLLRPGGRCLVRIPLVHTWPWRQFGVKWVEFDAPRHLYLFAPETMAVASRHAGLRLISCAHESAGWEIGWSKLYAEGVPMRRNGSRSLHERFSAAELQAFEYTARELNQLSIGGRAAFVLERPAS